MYHEQPFRWRPGHEPTPGATAHRPDDLPPDRSHVLEQNQAAPHRIIELPPGAPNPDRLFVRRITMAPLGRVEDRRFARVILDEAHSAKKEEGQLVNYLRLENYNAIHFVTASPIMSTSRDMLNYLEIAWLCSGLDEVFKHVPDPQDNAELLKVYRESYDPVGPGGIFEAAARGDGPSRLVSFVTAPGRDWAVMPAVWVLHPAWYKRLGRSMAWGDDFSTLVVSRVLRVFQRRRTMMTPLRLPDGSTVFPGSGMPGTKITMEEVSYDPIVASEVSAFCQARKNFVGGDAGEQGYVQAHGRDIRALPDQAIIDYANYRHASLASFDFRNAQLLESDDDAALALEAEAARRVAAGVGTSELVQPTGFGPGALVRPTSTMTVDEVNRIIESDYDGGLSHMHRLTCREPFVMPPTNRADMAWYTLAYSPTMIRVAELCREWVLGNKERVFILLDIPWAQQ